LKLYIIAPCAGLDIHHSENNVCGELYFSFEMYGNLTISNQIAQLQKGKRKIRELDFVFEFGRFAKTIVASARKENYQGKKVPFGRIH
jgi:hypothetical protein